MKTKKPKPFDDPEKLIKFAYEIFVDVVRYMNAMDSKQAKFVPAEVKEDLKRDIEEFMRKVDKKKGVGWLALRFTPEERDALIAIHDAATKRARPQRASEP